METSDPIDPSTSTISILVVDDHPAICAALTHLIDQENDMRVSGTVSSTQEALAMLARVRSDVAIVNMSLKDSHGLDLVERIRDGYESTESVVFSMYDERIYAERAIRAGAMGYLMKTEPTSELLAAIRSAHRGVVYVSPEITRRILRRLPEEQRISSGSPLEALSDRELAVFQLMAEGHSIDEIADHLDLARKTVETYRRAAKEKLGLESIEELIRYATTWLLNATDEEP